MREKTSSTSYDREVKDATADYILACDRYINASVDCSEVINLAYQEEKECYTHATIAFTSLACSYTARVMIAYRSICREANNQRRRRQPSRRQPLSAGLPRSPGPTTAAASSAMRIHSHTM